MTTSRPGDGFAEAATVIEDAADGFIACDAAFQIVFVNRAAERLSGRTKTELAGTLPWEVSSDLGGSALEREGRRVMAERLPAILEYRQRKHALWLEVRVSPAPWGGISIWIRDITGWKRIEKELRESEYWLKESQRISRIGSYVLDFAMGTWTGSEILDEIVGAGADYPRTVDGWQALIYPEDREKVMEHIADDVLRQKKPFDREYRIIRPADGGVRWVHGHGALVCDPAGAPGVLAGTLQDVTARRAVDEELRYAHELDGLGRLAGGIAHEFNNLLTVVNGYSDILLRQLKDGDPQRETVSEIRRAGESAAKLSSQLLTFSRKQILEPQLLDLNRLIGDNLGTLERLVGKDIELDTRLGVPLGWIIADPGQMHQVLLNLVTNARDAMPSGGKLTLANSCLDLRESDHGMRPGTPSGPYVLLTVGDTGTGIATEIWEYIFDPFFTTKTARAGTGLGLATVQGIVQQSGGTISFETEINRGTTFHVYLPRTEAVPDQPPAEPPSDELGGSETILIVEDQGSVRKLAAKMLRERGYRILDAAQGEEALLLAESYEEPIDLLLTDLVMPRMTGKDLAERLKGVRPDMKVLYMSGYAGDVIASRRLLAPGLFYIAKPFTAEELALKVRAALGSAHHRAPQKLLVVDDEDGVRTYLQKVLADAGYAVLVAENGNQALRMVRTQQVDLVLTDLVMPEKEGIETIQSLRKELPDLKIIAMSGAFGGGLLQVAKRVGANYTLAKPVAPEQLIAAVKGVLR